MFSPALHPTPLMSLKALDSKRTSQLDSKLDSKALKIKDSPFSNYQKINPQFNLLDSNHSPIPSKSNPLKINVLSSKALNAKHRSNLQVSNAKVNPKDVKTLGLSAYDYKSSSLSFHPRFVSTLLLSSLSVMSVFNTPSVAAQSWTTSGSSVTITNTGTLDKIDSNNTGSISANGNKQFNDLEISENGSITSTGSNVAITVNNNATIENINNKGNITGNKNTVLINKNSTINNFTNTGMITSTGNNAGIAIENNANVNTLINKGTIQNTGTGVGVRINKGTLNDFSNSGVISSKGSKNNDVIGIYNSTISNFSNSGTINGDNETFGVYTQKSTLTTFINTGMINGSAWGVAVDGSTIENFINKGTIKQTSTGLNLAAVAIGYNNTPSHIKTVLNEGLITSKGSNGIFYEVGNNVETIINKGTIQAEKYGIHVSQIFGPSQDNQKLGKIILESGSITEGKEGGVNINITNGKTLELGGLEIQEGSTLKSTNGAAIAVAPNNQITGDITIAGTIEAKTGISNEGEVKANITLSGEVKNFSVENKGSGNIGGSIEAKDNVALSVANSGSGSIGGSITSSSSAPISITNSGNANIAGDIKTTGNAPLNITNSGSGKIEGGVTTTGSGAVSITNSSTQGIAGNIQTAGQTTIANSGNLAGSISSSSNAPLNITNSGSGNIGGSISASGDGKVSIKNTGEAKINKGISVSGNTQLVIDNTGSIGADSSGNMVTANGNAKVQIDNWKISTNTESGKLETLKIAGSASNNVKVENLTLDQAGLNLEELSDMRNLISGIDIKNVANVGTNGSGEIQLARDPLTGKLSTNIELNAGIAGATYRNLMNNSLRRSGFIDSVVGNSMNTLNNTAMVVSSFDSKDATYADLSNLIRNDVVFKDSSHKEKDHSLFFLPYHSYQKTELSLGELSKGTINGMIGGYSFRWDKSIYGVYVGYEDIDMQSTYFNIANRAYYTGFKYYKDLYTLADNQELYMKLDSKLAFIQNDLTKRIGNNIAQAGPKTYGYGVSGSLGINFDYEANTFSPEISVAYEGGYTEAYNMENKVGQATVRGGERYYVNKLNLFSTKLGLSWYRDWHPNLKTLFHGGVKFTINPLTTSSARFGSLYANDEYLLPRIGEFLGASLMIPLNDAFYFSLNYNGNFDKNGHMHTGYAQFNYAW